MLACSSLALADSSPWNGSYAAEGGCFCVGEQGRNIDSQIVPTPVGGQSVAQVCRRVGEGPTLRKINGKFNYTVYPDAQCGNGPFSVSATQLDEECVGHLGSIGEDCAARGPRWNLREAYSKAAKTQLDNSTPLDNSKNSIVTGGSRYIDPPVKRAADFEQSDQPAASTSVKEIAGTRADAQKLERQSMQGVVRQARKKVVPETREQIRARQLVHLAEARERAKQAELDQSNSAAVPTVSVTTEPLSTTSESADSKLSGADSTAANKQIDKSTPSIDLTANTEPEKIQSVLPESSTKASVESVADDAAKPAATKETPTTVTALKVPATLSYGGSDFDFIEASPVSFDFGGNGLSIGASKSSQNRMHYVLSAAAADTYREAAVGIGSFFSPTKSERVTLMASAGMEYGLFNFSNNSVKADVSDTGAFVGFAAKVAVSRKFALQAGVNYSSFFEGDVVGFGSAFYQLTPKLDLTARAEAGDNDLLGFGIRYHY